MCTVNLVNKNCHQYLKKKNGSVATQKEVLNLCTLNWPIYTKANPFSIRNSESNWTKGLSSFTFVTSKMFGIVFY